VGRYELPPPPDDGPLRDLALLLQAARRRRRGLTYRVMAERTGLPRVTLQRAADGRTLPSRATVLAYLKACGVRTERALRLRGDAAAGRLKPRPPPQSKPYRPVIAPQRPWRTAAYPHQVISVYDLVDALWFLRDRMGGLSPAELSRRAAKNQGYSLSRSAIYYLLGRKGQPTQHAVQAFVRACGAPRHEWDDWDNAWRRAVKGAPPSGPHLPRPRTRSLRREQKREILRQMRERYRGSLDDLAYALGASR
jgi:DNA-binding phage protein